ncbi:MAG: CRISPR-associated endonuclease Cas1 [Syntrophales bacterium]
MLNIFGNASCTPLLMGFCAGNGVGISFLTEHWRFLARVQGQGLSHIIAKRDWEGMRQTT